MFIYPLGLGLYILYEVIQIPIFELFIQGASSVSKEHREPREPHTPAQCKYMSHFDIFLFRRVRQTYDPAG